MSKQFCLLITTGTANTLYIFNLCYQGLYHPNVRLKFERCPELPKVLFAPQAIQVGGDVYISGVDNHRSYVIFRFSLFRSTWNQVPSPPVSGGGLAYISTKLVSVGGYDRSNRKAVDNMYVLDGNSYSPLASMKTARAFPKCVNYNSFIIAFGGLDDADLPIRTIEVYNCDTEQWELAKGTLPWPIALNITSLALIHDTCYFLGTTTSDWDGKVGLLKFVPEDKVLVVPLSSAPQFQSTSLSVTSDTMQYTSVAASLCGSLLSLGGGETDDERRMIRVYSPLTNSWVHITETPTTLSNLGSVAVQLSDVELLIVQTERCKVYKCMVCK